MTNYRTTINVTPAQRAALNAIAAQHGCFDPFHIEYMERPNISELMRRIADGTLIVVNAADYARMTTAANVQAA